MPGQSRPPSRAAAVPDARGEHHAAPAGQPCAAMNGTAVIQQVCLTRNASMHACVLLKAVAEPIGTLMRLNVHRHLLRAN